MRFSTTAAVAATVAGSAAAQSICDKYTTALLKENSPANQYSLVTLLVKTAALGNFTGPGSANPTLPGSVMAAAGFLTPATYMGEDVNLMPYFDGTFESSNVNDAPASVNWLDGPPAATEPLSVGQPGSNTERLIGHLVQYFGVLLGCSGYGQDGFMTYQGDNSQARVHRFMDLSEAEFSYFIVGVGASAASFGASTEDINAAAMALNSTFGYRCAPAAAVVPDTDALPQVICGGASCPLSPNATCSGDVAYSTVVESAPSSLATPYPTGAPTPVVGSGTGVIKPSGTATSLATFNPNAAPRKTAAAGLLAAAGAVAAAFL